MQQGKNCPLLFVLFYFLDGLGRKTCGALSSHSKLGTVSVSFRDKGSWVQNALELSATDEFSFRMRANKLQCYGPEFFMLPFIYLFFM